ncbi:MAG: hypothetical protein AAFO79_00270 [Pseudomonadota bacterium]
MTVDLDTWRKSPDINGCGRVLTLRELVARINEQLPDQKRVSMTSVHAWCAGKQRPRSMEAILQIARVTAGQVTLESMERFYRGKRAADGAALPAVPPLRTCTLQVPASVGGAHPAAEVRS